MYSPAYGVLPVSGGTLTSVDTAPLSRAEVEMALAHARRTLYRRNALRLDLEATEAYIAHLRDML